MTETTMGERIRIARNRKSLKQADLGRSLGLAGHGMVSQWERDEAIPTGEQMVGLVGKLGISGHWLLTGEGPMEPPGVGSTAADQAAIEAVQEAMDDAIRRIRERGAH